MGVEHKAVRFAVFSQVSLFAALLACYVVRPSVIHSPQGLSNYGVYWPSVVPYTLGLGLYALFIFFSARHFWPSSLGRSRADSLRKELYVLVLLLAAVLLTTYVYKTGEVLNTTHRIIGTMLVLWQIWLGVRFASLPGQRVHVLPGLLLAVMMVSAILMAVALFTPAGFLSTFQIVFAAAFGVLYVMAMERLYRKM